MRQELRYKRFHPQSIPENIPIVTLASDRTSHSGPSNPSPRDLATVTDFAKQEISMGASSSSIWSTVEGYQNYLYKSLGYATDEAVKHKVIFVLGGPGSGKGTQCAKLVADYDMAHFSAGDLLREHANSGTPDGNMVADMIKNGQIVPAEITVRLLQKAMQESGKKKILIDGFPRNDENREAFQAVIGYDCEVVLFFDCPESVLEERLLKRGESSGRINDNLESIKKRFKVRKVDTNRDVDVIYTERHIDNDIDNAEALSPERAPAISDLAVDKVHGHRFATRL
eukprot:gene3603-13686_t